MIMVIAGCCSGCEVDIYCVVLVSHAFYIWCVEVVQFLRNSIQSIHVFLVYGKDGQGWQVSI